MPPDEDVRTARIDRVVASFELLMQRVASSHAPDLMEVAVTMSQAKALYVVAASAGMRMSELAMHLGVSISTTSGLVDRLVDHRLLVRHDDPVDRRQVVVKMTTAGNAALERFRELNAAQIRRLLARLGDPELGIVEDAAVLLAAAAGETFPASASRAVARANADATVQGDQS